MKKRLVNRPIVIARAACLMFCAVASYADEYRSEASPLQGNQTMSLLQQSSQTEALKITDNIYQAVGFGNTFLIVTDQGNVVIDTSMSRTAQNHKKLLDAVDAREPSYIIVTHGHGDHIGGVPIWKGKSSKLIMQQNTVEFLNYQKRLTGFFARRNAAQFGLKLADLAVGNFSPGNYAATIPADVLFDQEYSFKLGDLSFEVKSAPGETLDALTVWIPERKAVFVGDLYYTSFPNIYTLRGTKPRWALDYVNSLNQVLALKPEYVIPSHGDAIVGWSDIEETLTQYRDAILYVHDAVVAGMNAGKSEAALVKEIRLPSDLKVPENYGQVAWSVRGIYQGYAGWFDGNPSTMLGIDSAVAYPALIEMAGGLEQVASQSKEILESGAIDTALSLAEVVLKQDPDNQAALSVKRAALSAFLEESKNFNEAGWLKHGIREAN